VICHLIYLLFYLLFIPTDIPVILPPDDELVFTDRHLGQGLQASETELPNESAGGKQVCNAFLSFSKLTFCNSVSSLPQFNEAAMAQLEAMGFPTIHCQKALLATVNQDPEVAMEWLFGHMEDPGTLLAILLRYLITF
jgi:ubiquitin carboxyl-terminal hydrolase 5/13